MQLQLVSRHEVSPCDIELDKFVVAGWTGRDPRAVEEHIRELEELGVKRPSTVPVFYFVSRSRVTTASRIEVLGDNSSGEAECVILRHGGEFWIGVGSDHTDRTLEIADVSQSKQICEKPIGSTFWKLADIADHWDSLKVQSFVVEGGHRTLYQDGSTANLLPPMALVERYARMGTFSENMMMFCGTPSVIGGIRPADHFEFVLEDPVLGRRIAAAYDVAVLAVNQ